MPHFLFIGAVPFTVQIRCEPLGELVMLQIAHDDSGRGPAWFLEEARARQQVYTIHFI